MDCHTEDTKNEGGGRQILSYLKLMCEEGWLNSAAGLLNFCGLLSINLKTWGGGVIKDQWNRIPLSGVDLNKRPSI